MNNIMLFIIVGWLSCILGFMIASIFASGKIKDAYSEGYNYGFQDAKGVYNALEH